MDNEPGERVQRRAAKRKLKGMVFKWRIDVPRKPRGLRIARDADAAGREKLPLSSPLDMYRMIDSTLRLDPMNSLPVPTNPLVGQQLDYCKSTTVLNGL